MSFFPLWGAASLPSIDMDTWELAQKIDKMHSHPRYNSLNEISLFGGMLYCMDCGFALRHNTERHKRENGSVAFYESYMCGNYSRSGHAACSTHRIYIKPLVEVVLDDIRIKAEIADCSEAGMVRRMTEYRQSQSAQETDAQLQELERQIEDSQTVQNDVQEWVSLIRQYRNLESLGRETLFWLIDKIEIGEQRLSASGLRPGQDTAFLSAPPCSRSASLEG